MVYIWNAWHPRFNDSLLCNKGIQINVQKQIKCYYDNKLIHLRYNRVIICIHLIDFLLVHSNLSMMVLLLLLVAYELLSFLLGPWSCVLFSWPVVSSSFFLRNIIWQFYNLCLISDYIPKLFWSIIWCKKKYQIDFIHERILSNSTT